MARKFIDTIRNWLKRLDELLNFRIVVEDPDEEVRQGSWLFM